MTSTQNTAGPVEPAPRAIISGYTVHNPPGLAGVVDDPDSDLAASGFAQRAQPAGRPPPLNATA